MVTSAHIHTVAIHTATFRQILLHLVQGNINIWRWHIAINIQQGWTILLYMTSAWVNMSLLLKAALVYIYNLYFQDKAPEVDTHH